MIPLIEFALYDGPEPLSVGTICAPLNPVGTYLVHTLDGCSWLLKAPPQGALALCGRREIFDYAIGTRLGFSMAPWAFLHVGEAVSAEYRAREAGVSAEDEIAASVYFARRLPGDSYNRWGYLPTTLARKTPEIARQVGCAHMLNLWTMDAVSHRYLGTHKDNKLSQLTFFGYALSSKQEMGELRSRAIQAYDRACSVIGTSEPVSRFLSELCMLKRADFDAAFTDVPLFWRDPDEEAEDITFLKKRRDWLCSLARSGDFAAA